MLALILALNKIRQMQTMSAAKSRVHSVDAASKLIILLGFIVAVTSFDYTYSERLLYFACYLLFIIRLSTIPLNIFFLPVALAMPLVVSVGLFNFYFADSSQVQILSWSIEQRYLVILVLMSKTILTLSATILTACTTSMTELYSALKRLGVPNILIMQLVLLINYIGVLLHEALHIVQAYSLRSGQQSIALRDYPALLGQFFLGSYLRATQLYQAMLCRGFQGEYSLRTQGRINWLLVIANLALFIYWRL